MLDLTSEDTFVIEGRGRVYTLELPDEWVQEHDPRTLMSQEVRIDGVVHVVKGVELFAIAWHPGVKDSVLRKAGLLVDE